MWHGFEFTKPQGIFILGALIAWIIISTAFIIEEKKARDYYKDKKPLRQFKSWWIAAPEGMAISALLTIVGAALLIILYGIYGVVAGAFNAVF